MSVEDRVRHVTPPNGGEFATSRKGALDYGEFENVRSWCAVGVPAQDMAKMLGRPISDVLPVIACLPRALRDAYSPPVAPKPLVVFNHGRPAVLGPFVQIARDVAKAHGVTVAELRGHDRSNRVAWARQDAFWRLRNGTSLSLPHIGQWFGGRDHSTVIHGVRAHQKRLDALALVAAE